MNAAGIIVEYNPLHCGHVHLLRETRRLLGEDTALV
ncbi:MAG: nucleotidyltransferase family protein [Oscillibacter sp.]|nr:nucleotidyltransferase family protein [Oscillibacter sp.]